MTRDQEATRRFYEDLIGLPLVATWSEADELFGAERVYCHTFFGLADGSALAFFQFADDADQELFGPAMPETPFSHIALKVEPDAQDAVAERLAAAGYTEPATFVLDHGYCRSLYVRDPNGLLIELTADHPDAVGDRRHPRRERPRGPGPLAGRRSHQQQHVPLTSCDDRAGSAAAHGPAPVAADDRHRQPAPAVVAGRP